MEKILEQFVARRGDGILYVDTMPDRECEKAPELSFVDLSGRFVLAQDPVDRALPEMARAQDLGRIEELLGAVLEPSLYPLIYRNSESVLLSPEDLFRHERAHGLLEDVLLLVFQ